MTQDGGTTYKQRIIIIWRKMSWLRLYYIFLALCSTPILIIMYCIVKFFGDEVNWWGVKQFYLGNWDKIGMEKFVSYKDKKKEKPEVFSDCVDLATNAKREL